MRKIIVLLIVLALMSSCSSTGANRAAETATQQVIEISEAYALYSALIEARYVQSNIELIVIRDHTSLDPQEDLDTRLEYVQKNIPELTSQMVTEFKNNNQQADSLQPQFDLNVKYVLLSEEQWQEIFTATDLWGAWEEFYQRYPASQGELTLSGVGFNTTLDMALVYVGNQSGPLAGAGYYLLMVKENGVWIVSKEDMAWIS